MDFLLDQIHSLGMDLWSHGEYLQNGTPFPQWALGKSSALYTGNLGTILNKTQMVMFSRHETGDPVLKLSEKEVVPQTSYKKFPNIL
jgi:hypothetical protein